MMPSGLLAKTRISIKLVKILIVSIKLIVVSLYRIINHITSLILRDILNSIINIK